MDVGYTQVRVGLRLGFGGGLIDDFPQRVLFVCAVSCQSESE